MKTSPTRSAAVQPDQFATLGELLRYLRLRAGLTQRELSIAVGYSESQISRLEQNQRLPEAAILQARFVPAFQLETEPEWVARLLDLAGVPRPPAEPPPAAPAARPSNNLPTQLTSFVGREKAMADIQELLLSDNGLAVARLITLTGHGGCGKTRLALQAAAGLLAAFPAGVWLVELAPVADPDLVPRAVANALDLPETPDDRLLPVLTAHLRDRQSLLILDNCEHLIQASAQIAEALLQACPPLRILATSREMLGVAGERPFVVPPLSTPALRSTAPTADLLTYEAVRLFVERAAVVAPDFTLNPANTGAVVQICQRLDGIPLAIELAAARLRMLPVEQIAARLDNAFRLLTGGSRTALPRHQTLQALIDWSYDLLTPSEAALLRRLSVFSGGWTLEAAEAICSGGQVPAGELFELLAHLIDKSLVLVTQSEHSRLARYRLLETLRQYTAARLAASGEADAVRERHAAYYFALAEAGAPASPGGPTDMGWLNGLESENDNLRAALSWSLSAMGAGPSVQWGGSGDIRTTAWALNRLGWAARERGDFALARARLDQSLAVYRELGDLTGIAWTANTLGEVLVMQNEAAAAQPILEEGLALARELGETTAVSWALNHLGHVAQLQGDYERATQLQQASLEMSQAHDHDTGVAWALHGLGESALAQRDGVTARRCFIQSLEIFEHKNDWPRVAWCLAGLAGVAALEAKPRQAAWLWGAAETLRQAKRVHAAPAAHDTHERLQADARRKLGQAEFNLAWVEGQAASREQILAVIHP